MHQGKATAVDNEFPTASIALRWIGRNPRVCCVAFAVELCCIRGGVSPSAQSVPTNIIVVFVVVANILFISKRIH